MTELHREHQSINGPPTRPWITTSCVLQMADFEMENYDYRCLLQIIMAPDATAAAANAHDDNVDGDDDDEDD